MKNYYNKAYKTDDPAWTTPMNKAGGRSVVCPINFILDDEKAKLPVYKTKDAAGMDVTSVEDCVIEPGEWVMVNTGLKAEIPRNFEIQVRPRSGLAAKHGVTVLNAPGTIDSDYRGLIKVILINHSKDSYHVHEGDRIAQLVVARCLQATVYNVDHLTTTSRGERGFGSTGR